MLDSRKTYIAERESRAIVKHEAEMHYEKAVMEAKLEEMRQNAMDRKVERERRAELHAMTMRHREGLFSRQIQLLDAAQNALACSSSDVALGSMISLAIDNAGVSFVGSTMHEAEIASTHAEQLQSNENDATESIQ